MLPSSIPIPLPGGLHRPLPKFISVAQKFSTEILANIDAAIANLLQRKAPDLDRLEAQWQSLEPLRAGMTDLPEGAL